MLVRCRRDGRGTAEREQALGRLHELLLRAAHAELRRRSRPAGVEGRELDDLAHQAADDAVVAITGKLDRFRGDSRFTTWAYKFVILEVSAKLGRHYCATPRSRPETMRGNESLTGSAPIPRSTPSPANWPARFAGPSQRY